MRSMPCQESTQKLYLLSISDQLEKRKFGFGWITEIAKSGSWTVEFRRSFSCLHTSQTSPSCLQQESWKALLILNMCQLIIYTPTCNVDKVWSITTVHVCLLSFCRMLWGNGSRHRMHRYNNNMSHCWTLSAPLQQHVTQLNTKCTATTTCSTVEH